MLIAPDGAMAMALPGQRILSCQDSDYIYIFNKEPSQDTFLF